MCGITGALYANPVLGEEQFVRLIKKMSNTLVHRGPDDSGAWVDAQAGIGLGHRRLSIVDLSSSGHQPMISSNKRYVIIFNGEIYNFKEIKTDLQKRGIQFVGHSDTEVLLESIAIHGLEKTLDEINGMFAFALWDREDRILILARDRIGKKPLFYGWCGNVLLFGSELKALRCHPNFDSQLDRDALGQFIQFNWLSGPSSIYRKIKKLQPGCYLRVLQQSFGEEITPKNYWLAQKKAQDGIAKPFSGTYDQAADKLEGLLKDSIQHRMIADVELGALLSGGIDSSLVVAIMQAQSERRVKTFTIGFHEATHNEAVHARKVAEYLGTDHTELYVTPQECMDVIPELPAMFDEPFGDVSQIPTYLVSKLAREKVKVVLSGDGGDELFAGYTRYFRCLNQWKKHENISPVLRPVIGRAMEVSAAFLWSLLGNTTIDAELKGWRRFGEKLEKRARRINAKSSLELFVRMMTRYENISDIVIDAQDPDTILHNRHLWPSFHEPVLNMMMIDTLCYLPDDILVKVDRASMATSLEARCPMLDKNIIEFAWQLPFEMKVNQSGGKRILKHLLTKYIPSKLTERKKMGFGVPIGSWLRGQLKDWADELLDPAKIREQAYLNPDVVQKLWRQHQSGWRNHDDILWSILMFQAWYETINSPSQSC